MVEATISWTLHNTDAENRRLNQEVGRLKIENIFLKNELNTVTEPGQGPHHLSKRTPPLRHFMAGGDDHWRGRGGHRRRREIGVCRSSETGPGIERGMAVVTPDGIAGKVIASYPADSQVMLVTDSDFAAGVISQKNQAFTAR